jgi:PEP-CTERM motif
MIPSTPHVAAALLLAAATGVQAFSYDEAVDGDLSGNRLEPTWLTAVAGSNLMSMSSTTGDRDYVGFTVPAGLQLSSIFHVRYESADDFSFMGLQAGAVFTEPPTGTDASQLLGYYVFGAASAGTEIIDDLGNSDVQPPPPPTRPPAQGFTPPLPAGPYTFWIQQTGAVAHYTFDFVLTPVPEPATSALTLLGGLALAGALRRRRPAPR